MARGTAIGRRTFLAATMASVAAPAVSRIARGDAPQFTLKLQHGLSSVSSGHDKFLTPWARKIEAQANGRIRIDIFPAMQLGGQPAQLFDQVRDGVVEIAWTEPGRTPGRFPKIETFELPFVPSRRALVSSRAIQDFSADNLKDEFREVHPICFACADRGIVHANRQVQTIGDLKGLRLHVQTRLAGEAVRALGALPVPMPSAQLPLAITRRVVDGCVDPWDMVPALKLNDLLKAHTDFADVSLSTTTYMLAMNKAAYERLPADLKTVIDGNSGQVAAGMAGAMFDLRAAAVADMVSQRGDAIVTLMPEAVAHWQKATEPVIELWRKQMKDRKIDGEALLASVRTLLEKYAGEPEPPPPPKPEPLQPRPAAEAEVEVNAPPAAAQPVAPPPPVAPHAAPPAAPPVTPPAAAAPPPLLKPAPAAASPPTTIDIPL